MKPAASVQPTVSVLLPFYDAEATLKECVDSILGQQLMDFEVVTTQKIDQLIYWKVTRIKEYV